MNRVLSFLVLAAGALVLPAVAFANPPPAAAAQCDNTFFFATQALCQRTNKLCGYSRNRQGCWSPIESFAVDGRTVKQNPVIFKMPANITVYVERIDNEICLEPSCTFKTNYQGMHGRQCSALPDCDVAPTCNADSYGGLMRDECTAVTPGSFPSGGGRHVFFINQEIGRASCRERV